MKKSEIFFGLIRIPLDFAMAMLAMFAAYYLRAQETLVPFLKKPDLGIFPPLPDFFKLAVFGSILLLFIFTFFRMYSLRITASFGLEMRKIFLGGLIWLMAVITYYFLLREFPFSRAVLFYSWFFVIACVTFGRLFIYVLQRLMLKWGIGQRRIVLLGGGDIGRDLKEILQEKGIYKIIGVVSSFSELQTLFEEMHLDEIIQTSSLQLTEPADVLDFCREHHLVYHFIPDILEVSRTNVEVKTFGGIPLISLKPTPLDGWGRVLKRVFDFTVSLAGLIILSPVFLIIAVLIKLDSKGPVFFRFLDDRKTLAKRVGRKGKLFCCLKFRTMKEGTHAMRYSEEFLKKNVRHGSPLVKIENDPRVTRVGKFLRKYSFDEFPQLWNVLKGEMSLVGPRPHLPEEVGHYKRHHKFVLTLSPGITGLAQISGRSDLPFEEEVRLDTFYIENWSLWLDIKIILKTFFVLFRGYKE